MMCSKNSAPNAQGMDATRLGSSARIERQVRAAQRDGL